MRPDTLMLLSAVAGPFGVGLLRLSWSRDRRVPVLNGLGWVLILSGAAGGWAAGGAWGTAVATLWTMTAACTLLAVAAIRSTTGKAQASNRRAGLVPSRGEPLRIGARCLTFVLVAVVATAFAIGAAVAVGGLLGMAGWTKSDTYALSLFAMPLLWGVLVFALLMQPRRAGQLKVLAWASLPTWPVLAAGVLA